ncbi:hypothetical protein KIW84_076478 [Lathyrus oleraceus]|uniref:Uncharacterized protein n=1 Tax=Pisum sativum TaxID=3888 RepID=A0A9D4ZZI0_PEA|nr:hypothetical protein KIW84_076478 [Pisum sativum]
MARWDFLRYMMKRMGFGVVWMKVTIFASQMSVLINASSNEDFKVEGLAGLVRNAPEIWEFRGFNVTEKCKVDILQFAYDTLLISEGNWKNEFEEASHVEGSEDDSDYEDMAFIIKRFQYLGKKNKRFFDISIDFKGLSSIEKKYDHKGYFNSKKPSNFVVDCPELQKDKCLSLFCQVHLMKLQKQVQEESHGDMR